MPSLRAAILLSVCLAFPPALRAQDPEGPPQLDDVLARMREAARGWQTLSADFTRYDHDLTFRKMECREGRLYFEKPNLGRYEVLPDAGDDNSRELWIWNGAETLWVDFAAQRYAVHTPADIKRAQEFLQTQTQPPSASDGFIERFFFAVFSMPLQVATPQDALPLLLDADEHLEKRFELTVERRSRGDLLLTAVPKRVAEQCFFKRIRVLVNPDTYEPFATDCLDPYGVSRTVHLLHNLRFDRPRPDRDELLHPNLDGFERISP